MPPQGVIGRNKNVRLHKNLNSTIHGSPVHHSPKTGSHPNFHQLVSEKHKLRCLLVMEYHSATEGKGLLICSRTWVNPQNRFRERSAQLHLLKILERGKLQRERANQLSQWLDEDYVAGSTCQNSPQDFNLGNCHKEIIPQ